MIRMQQSCDFDFQIHVSLELFLWVFYFQIHASLELFCLTLIAIGVGMKMRWLGLKSFLKHKRTAIKVSSNKPLPNKDLERKWIFTCWRAVQLRVQFSYIAESNVRNLLQWTDNVPVTILYSPIGYRKINIFLTIFDQNLKAFHLLCLKRTQHVWANSQICRIILCTAIYNHVAAVTHQKKPLLVCDIRGWFIISHLVACFIISVLDELFV